MVWGGAGDDNDTTYHRARAEQVKDAFSVFASAGGGASANRGYIRKADLVTALSTYGEDPLTATEAEELVSHLETDAGGYIHYDECVLVLRRAGVRCGQGGGCGCVCVCVQVCGRRAVGLPPTTWRWCGRWRRRQWQRRGCIWQEKKVAVVGGARVPVHFVDLYAST